MRDLTTEQAAAIVAAFFSPHLFSARHDLDRGDVRAVPTIAAFVREAIPMDPPLTSEEIGRVLDIA